ncbi:Xaa-Pro dipeptidyl-peptidase [Pedobacter frigoris]|uniref:Xaa-Pro dipeptidyl-peptidase n=1 Tax=Pedobacter frigoris TaxID=2571272 RepID=A0A4V5NZY7_9SPHI|nr:Xaa-Pro dipeptidyl-peptidase [Pedobacter frigoris]TKC08822.1 Xaa-Pro dipeptidyl-peptidase [Pedobacter frigoris]
MINLHLKKSKYLFLSLSLFTTLPQAFAQEKAAPVFKDGEAQIVTSFDTPDKWIRHDLWVETTFDTDGDGKPDRMHVSITRPFQTETEGLKLPVIYETSPYYSGTAGNAPGTFWDVKHEVGEKPPIAHLHPTVIRTGARPIISNSLIREWVKRGFIIVHSESPGTGLSQGSPTVGGINESLAPKAVIEWLSGKDNGYTAPDGNEKVKAYWSTGNVGMTGTSYNGTLPLAAATTGVEGLKAIIPVAPNTSYYHYYRSNGLVRSPGGYLGEDVDVLYDFIHSGAEDKRAYGDKTFRDGEMAKGMDRVTGDYNDFWAGRDYLNAMKPMKAALLMSHGFNDWNVMPEHSYRIYKAAEAKGLPVQIYYHQGGHGGPPPMKMMNRWFTRYLFGIENGVEKDPKAWIVRENEPANNPTSYADYPNPAAADVKLYPGAGGITSGKLSTTKPVKQPSEKLIDDVTFSGSDLAKAEKSDHRLLYVTPVLKEAVHLSGLTQVTVKLASSKPAANFSVWLVALPWSQGQTVRLMDNVITRGWADPQNNKSLTKSAPLVPGKFYDLKFSLQPDDQIIPAGKQIGLMIFSSDKEFTLWPKAGTEITIDLNGTTLTLPVVGGLNAFEKATK